MSATNEPRRLDLSWVVDASDGFPSPTLIPVPQPAPPDVAPVPIDMSAVEVLARKLGELVNEVSTRKPPAVRLGGGGPSQLLNTDGVRIDPALSSKQPDVVGTWGYAAGTSGTEALTDGKRVLSITAVAGAGAASFTIDGGDTITLPANRSVTLNPEGNLTDPTIVFTGTTAYVVDFVS